MICRAIDSCFRQKVDIEVILVDDGSSDGTYSHVVNTYASLVEQGQLIYAKIEHLGQSAARNKGLSIAGGKYIKFLDSDDFLIDEALPKEVAYAERINADVIVTGYMTNYYADPDRMTLIKSDFIDAPKLDNGIDDMLLGNAPLTTNALYKREKNSSFKME